VTAATTLQLTSPDVVADPYPHFAEARNRAPVQWHDGLGMWLTFTHDAANAVLRARTLGRIWAPRWPDEPMPAFALIHVNSLLENEPPEHTRLRRLVAGAFATSSGCGRGWPCWPTSWPTGSPTSARTGRPST
jgi:cytochrome P450